MRKGILAVIVVLAPPAFADTTYYQCKDANGHAVFSQTPCGADARRETVTVPASSGTPVQQSDYWDEVAAENAARSARQEIARRQATIENLKRERESKIDKLRLGGGASVEVEGVNSGDYLADQMLAVNRHYANLIAEEDKVIRQLQGQLNATK